MCACVRVCVCVSVCVCVCMQLSRVRPNCRDYDAHSLTDDDARGPDADGGA